MKCTRCEGLMLEDDFIDMQESGGLWLRAWRCLNCGHAVDSVMVANRQRQALLVSPHAEQEESVPESDLDVIATLAA